ncbi:MAG: hypothetical protein GX318_00460 [Clostridia bacterium]|nr:hypothetical protein [Clostridia bacterium]
MSVIATSTKLVLRCPSCGEVGYHDLLMFTFAHSISSKYECSCGFPVAYLSTRDKKHYLLQIECCFCEDIHPYYYLRKDLWGGETLSLECDDSGLEVAFVGSEENVREAIENSNKSLAEMAEDLGFGDYFTNPEIMYGILDYLNQLAEDGNLYCQCGYYNIEIEIYPDRLELKCDACGCMGMIMAQKEKDLEAVRDLPKMELTRKGIVYLGEHRERSRRRFKK